MQSYSEIALAQIALKQINKLRETLSDLIDVASELDLIVHDERGMGKYVENAEITKARKLLK